jgi:predicted outer membrane protein
MYFRLAAAFGSPTKTGAFGENLALAAGEMADVSAGRRKSLAERAARQADLQKLRYQMAGEEVSALRSAQAAGETGQRAIAQKLVEDYIASGKPQSEAGKIARDMGLQMGTPEHAAFVEDYTRTKMEKELAALQIQQQAIGRMPTAMVNLKVETEDKVNNLTQAMGALEEAYARNANSYSGSALDQMQYGALSMLGSDAPKVINTRIIENLLGEQALGQLKATFGAAPTEGERKILMDLQGIGAKSLEERGEIMLRLYQILQQRRDREAARLQEITQGSYGFYEPSTQGE